MLLVGMAVLLALDPDYPVPRGVASAMSTESGLQLLPRALQPVGLTPGPAPRFAWQWTGPEVAWDLVLLDAALDEILRVRGIWGCEYVAAGSLADALREGRTFHWYVESELAGRSVRCPLAAVRFTP